MVADTIEAIQGEIGAKCDAIAEILAANEAKVHLLTQEHQRIMGMVGNLEKANEFLKTGLMFYLQGKGVDRLETDFHRFKVARNGGKPPLEITGEVPDDYTYYEQKTDTAAIRQALENGERLEFARLQERGKHLRIS
jgi:hypothetical protein